MQTSSTIIISGDFPALTFFWEKKKENETLLLTFRVGFMKRSFSTNSGMCTKYVVSPRTAGPALQEPGFERNGSCAHGKSSTLEFQVKANMWEALRALIKRSINFFQGNFTVCIKKNSWSVFSSWVEVKPTEAYSSGSKEQVTQDFR